jgi:uncharacterized protein DUF3300
MMRIMKAIKVQWIICQALGLICGSLLACGLVVAQQSAPTEQATEQLLSTEQLNTLVAPVALYPDALLSQVLVAATYPLEIVEVGQWLKRNSTLQGSTLVDAAREQKWDPSIQALVVFPDVIKRLNADIRWTTDLGNAFLSQQADVMNAVQRMRAQAMAAGKLQSNAQDTVTTEKQGDRSVIEIQPANPEVVYVPHYDPAYIWGPPLYGYYPAWDYPYVGFGFGFGPGIYIGRSFGGLYWGGWGWGPNWYQCSIYQNRYFFNHYGYGGHGYRYGAAWTHNPGHRQGVHYPNSALNQRYSGVSMARGGSSFSRFGGQSYASRQYNTAPRANQASSRRYSQSGFSSQGAQRSYSSTSAYNGSRAYRASPSYSGGYGGNRSVYSDRFSPSLGSSSRYRTSPSYSGSDGGNRSVYSDRFSPSFGSSSRYRASPSYSGGYGGNPSVRTYQSIPSHGSSGGYRVSPSSGGNSSVPGYRSGPSYAGRGGVQSTQSFGGGGSIRSGGGFRGGRGRR